MLAEIYQAAGRSADAISLLERISDVAGESHPEFAVSLCELYLEEERWEDALRLCGRVQNWPEASSYTMVMLLYKGRALAGQNVHEAAVEVFTDALRYRKERSVRIMSAVRMARAGSLVKLGSVARARKDVVRVVADMPDFEPARAALASFDR
jgi:tetratricopeptide (TPR) repeat protein